MTATQLPVEAAPAPTAPAPTAARRPSRTTGGMPRIVASMRNGRAAANVRAHVLRAAGRVVALLAVDLAAYSALRAGLHTLRATPRLGERAHSLVGARLPEGFLGGWQFAVALLLSLAVMGTYAPGDRRRSASRVVLACALAAALPLWAPVWANPVAVLVQFVMTVALTSAALIPARVVLDALLAHFTPHAVARTILLGPAARCREMMARERLAEQQGFALVGFVDPDDDAAPGALGPLSELRRLLVEHRADTVLLRGEVAEPTFVRIFKTAATVECRVLAAARTYLVAGLHPSVVWRRGQAFIELRAVAMRGQQLILKRLLDVVGSAVLLVLAAPLMALIAVAVRLGSPGPAVFGQRRLGKHGQSFRCYKFRSMYRDAELRLRTDPALREEYVRGGYKLPPDRDTRITPIGRLLRRTSLDELPQLWNVLKGDMSLVGPRPIVPDEILHYEGEAPMLLLLKPGMTGAWQVSGRSELQYPERTTVELEYVQNWSLKRDLGILLRTVPAVLGQYGAH